MSKRLQVLLTDAEMAEIQQFAKREQIPVGEWVRRTLRQAREQKSTKDPELKRQAIREAMKHSYPAPDIEQMNREIEAGYLE
ncbi:MAG: antitoxin [Acidobacteriota bacterium]